MSNANATKVLEFWFEQSKPEQWFKKDAAFDETIRQEFGSLVEEALVGKLVSWEADADGLLALVLVLDQFTRNLFRGDGKSFAGDERALALSFEGQERGYLETFDKHARHFLLVPMMHSEDLAVQEASLPLFQQYTDEETYGYAVKHRDIVARFDRFPHRNEVLGRMSTPEEIEFLKQPGSSF